MHQPRRNRSNVTLSPPRPLSWPLSRTAHQSRTYPFPPQRPAGASASLTYAMVATTASTVEHVLPHFFVEFLGRAATPSCSPTTPPLDLWAFWRNRPWHTIGHQRLFSRYVMYWIPRGHRTPRCIRRGRATALERVATRLKVANRAEHRALSDARLVKEVFSGSSATHTYPQNNC